MKKKRAEKRVIKRVEKTAENSKKRKRRRVKSKDMGNKESTDKNRRVKRVKGENSKIAEKSV